MKDKPYSIDVKLAGRCFVAMHGLFGMLSADYVADHMVVCGRHSFATNT